MEEVGWNSSGRKYDGVATKASDMDITIQDRMAMLDKGLSELMELAIAIRERTVLVRRPADEGTAPRLPKDRPDGSPMGAYLKEKFDNTQEVVDVLRGVLRTLDL